MYGTSMLVLMGKLFRGSQIWWASGPTGFLLSQVLGHTVKSESEHI